MLKLCLYAVVAFHFSVLIGNIMAIFVLPFLVPWYISLPTISLLVNFMSTNSSCPLTRLEDYIRMKLGMNKIHKFVRHYVVQPVRGFVK